MLLKWIDDLHPIIRFILGVDMIYEKKSKLREGDLV